MFRNRKKASNVIVEICMGAKLLHRKEPYQIFQSQFRTDQYHQKHTVTFYRRSKNLGFSFCLTDTKTIYINFPLKTLNLEGI
jgi:hypothetical protein